MSFDPSMGLRSVTPLLPYPSQHAIADFKRSHDGIPGWDKDVRRSFPHCRVEDINT